MASFDVTTNRLVGPGGELSVPRSDEVTRKLAMLMEGECDSLGPIHAARKFGFSKQRHFQIRRAFLQHGAAALQSQKREPKTNPRRPAEVVRQVIRHRFLDPDASAEVVAQKLQQSGWPTSIRSVHRVLAEFGLHKKLYQCRPQETPLLETQRTKKRTRKEPCDPASLERGVRQLLADKVSGNLVGLWLLIPEHLRLGTWDSAVRLEQPASEQVEPRLALQLVHEAALCTTGLRDNDALSQRGFELANGLPFVASDMAIHDLLAATHRGRIATAAGGPGTNSPDFGRLPGQTAGDRSASHPKLQQAADASVPRRSQNPGRSRWPRPSSPLTPIPISLSASPPRPRHALRRPPPSNCWTWPQRSSTPTRARPW